ncbi:hypothetical protein CSKR_107440 [Clonorchis sinensis]|uniref:Uncharacterized protein n=1 Tax=Clonorchis sinensis TaxID=79923 RepID=A0A3R7CG66_CLOSI|nr:hypothetical protein CSKR_107440 [Clonorchis sinensis]
MNGQVLVRKLWVRDYLEICEVTTAVQCFLAFQHTLTSMNRIKSILNKMDGLPFDQPGEMRSVRQECGICKQYQKRITTLKLSTQVQSYKLKNKVPVKRKKAFATQLFIIETPTQQLQTIGQGSKTPVCISFTELLERVFLNFPRYSLTVTQMQANSTNRLHKFRDRPHYSRDAKRIYEKT